MPAVARAAPTANRIGFALIKAPIAAAASLILTVNTLKEPASVMFAPV